MTHYFWKTALAVGFTIAASTASATTISFGPDNWDYNSSDEIGWTVDIDDDTSGFWTVAISTNADVGDTTGSMLGFGFDTSLTGLALSDLAKVSASTVEDITGFDTNSASCGSGCNFNGTDAQSNPFDYILKLGNNGSSDGLLEEFTFTIATTDSLLPDSFTRVGIRAQTVGNFPDGGNGSVKDINTTPTTPSPVPLPAAGWMLLAGLGGLGAVKRRKAA